MNCIILLLLLGCCGGCGGCRTSGRTGCCRENRRECRVSCGRMQNDCNCHDNCCDNGRDNCCDNGRDNCRDNCREERSSRNEDCGCGREERESCDIPGMIPPPWQDDYPKFPRRDDGCGCEG